MKHLKTFENFNEIDKHNYTQIIDNKEELETSTAFSEIPEHEQDILSDAYSKESETINKTSQTTIQEYFTPRGYWNTPN